MIRLADEFFAVKNDPTQIAVTAEVMERLRRIHPATLSEENYGQGPVAWILLIPTTTSVMEKFLAKQRTERELLEQTLPGESYDAVYLCSALVLPEYRRTGIAKRLTCSAVRAIQAEHPIRSLFTWSFSEEGAKLAEAVAHKLTLPLYVRPRER